jgi:hypothetical protein
MPRIRTIKPDFWTDPKIGKLKRDERLLFIGLWNLADDQGVVKSSSAYIKGQLFTYDEELRITTVDLWLTSLVKALMIVPFNHNEEGYYVIRTFKDHQLINRPSRPRFPSDLLDSILKRDSVSIQGGLIEGSQPEGKGREIEGKGDANDPFFEMFWRLGKQYGETVILHELAKFKNKYPDATPKTSGNLVNAWMSNVDKEKRSSSGKKEMVH